MTFFQIHVHVSMTFLKPYKYFSIKTQIVFSNNEIIVLICQISHTSLPRKEGGGCALKCAQSLLYLHDSI